MSDEPKGLAAIARQARDPEITVTSLRAAIAEGRLAHEIGVGGRPLVKLSDAQAAFSRVEVQRPVEAPVPAPVPAPAPAPVQSKPTLKVRRKGRTTR